MTHTPLRVLVVHYSFSRQTERVAAVIADALEQRGAEVTEAAIAFTDTRWAARFEKVPMRFPLVRIGAMLPAQIRKATGEIQVPASARSGDYDLIVIGSPTWWFRVSIPIRSYLRSPAGRAVLEGKAFAGFSTSRRYWTHNLGEIRNLGERAGGRWVDQFHFVAAGNQVQSMLSWLGYMSGFRYLDRVLRLPPTNLQDGFEAQARAFADDIADRAWPTDATAAEPAGS